MHFSLILVLTKDYQEYNMCKSLEICAKVLYNLKVLDPSLV